MTMRRTLHSWLCATLALAGLAAPAARADWPTLHRDNQRSGYTDEVVRGPYERKWFRDFHDEMISTRVEAIVAEGKAFIPTLAGRLHALDVATGETLWTASAAGPIGHSPTYRDGKLYFGADEGADAGTLYCVNAADGTEVWRYPAGAGIWVSPLVEGDAVYVGDRKGVFHAVDAATGRRRWTVQAGYMILAPASASPDGQRIVFASEDMHVYCVSPAGEVLWKSAKCGGLSLRDHAPTVWQDLVIVRSNPAASFHHAFGMHGGTFKQFHTSLPMEADDEVLFDQWGGFSMKWTPRRAAAEQKWILQTLAERPEEKTFHTFRLSDGSIPWTAPVLYNGGLHNPTPLPTFNPATGKLYVWGDSSLNGYHLGVPGGFIVVMSVDPKTGQTEILQVDRNVGRSFAQPGDETQALSLMGDTLLNTHQGSILGIDLGTKAFHPVIQERDSYGGIIGVRYNPTRQPAQGFYTGTYNRHNEGFLTCMANEWHGPDRSIAAIAEGRFFWIAGSQVVCIGGPDAPRTASGGGSPPEPIPHRLDMVVPGCNLAVAWAGTYDESVPVQPVTLEQVRPIVQASPHTGVAPAGELAQGLQAKLDAAVTEFVDGGPWAPLMVEVGISGECPEFWRPAQAMQIVALALPHLSPEVRTKAVAWLDAQYAAGYPLRKSRYEMGEGRRREPFDVGRTMTGGHQFDGVYNRASQPTIADAYAVWAYAHYADRWDRVQPGLRSVEALFQQYASEPFSFDHRGVARKPTGDYEFIGGNATERLNGQIAGLIGYARLLQHAGRQADADKVLALLAERVATRAHHERADTCFVRMDAFGNHSARVPRYLELTPESAALLHAVAGDALAANVAALATQLPVWYQAWGERLIGGENYINPPHLARALFIALADGTGAEPQRLAAVLDQPWCKADLYYIEKLSAALRAAEQ